MWNEFYDPWSDPWDPYDGAVMWDPGFRDPTYCYYNDGDNCDYPLACYFDTPLGCSSNHTHQSERSVCVYGDSRIHLDNIATLVSGLADIYDAIRYWCFSSALMFSVYYPAMHPAMHPGNIDADVKMARQLHETIRGVESLIGREHRSTDHYYANHVSRPPPNVPEPRGTHYSQYLDLFPRMRSLQHFVGKHVPSICDYSREEHSPIRSGVAFFDEWDMRATCEAAKHTTRGPVMEWCSR